MRLIHIQPGTTETRGGVGGWNREGVKCGVKGVEGVK